MDFFKIIKQVLDSVFWVLSLIHTIQTTFKITKSIIEKLKNLK